MLARPGIASAQYRTPVSIELVTPAQTVVYAIKSARRRIAAIAGAAALLLTNPIPGIHISTVAKQGRRLKSDRILAVWKGINVTDV
jgi:hypothetical protein